MTDKCQQVEARLEAYFSETMNLNDRIDIEQHIANCSACQTELDGYSKIDDLVETHFRWQVERAANRVSPRIQPLRLAGAMAALVVAAVVTWVGMSATVPSPDNMPVGSTAQTMATAVTNDFEKGDDTLDAELAKLEPVLESETITPIDRTSTTIGPVTAEARFYVQDTAGYFYTLEDYSGSVLVLGVINADQAGSLVFAKAYETYRSEPKIHFLGIASENALPKGVGFPTMANRNSTLLETRAGEFVIVGPDSTIYARGALEEEELSNMIAASLEQFANP